MLFTNDIIKRCIPPRYTYTYIYTYELYEWKLPILISMHCRCLAIDGHNLPLSSLKISVCEGSKNDDRFIQQNNKITQDKDRMQA